MQHQDRTAALDAEQARKIDAYWRAANYLSVGQIYLCDNPLLKEPLVLAHVKRMLLGHWGTTPGQNFIYTHLNRIIKKYDVDMIYMSGPGHGGPAVVGSTYLEGTYSEVYADVGQDEAGLKRLFTQFSFPGGIPSHASAECPGSIHEGGELGYSLSHAFGAVFDNPSLVVACVVGDGEAETGPLATSWHSNKFLNPESDGAVLPILHLNGYKIANPTILARISRGELEELLRGYGWTPYFVEGHEPMAMHEAMAATLDTVIEEIRRFQADARVQGKSERPRWPMIVLSSPKGWTGPKMIDGRPNEGTFRSHQVPLSDPAKNPEHLRQLENWLRSYRPEELFDERGRLKPELAALAPSGERRMGANPQRQRRHPAARSADAGLPDYAVDVSQAGDAAASATRTYWRRFLRDVLKLNAGRIATSASSGPMRPCRMDLEAVFEATNAPMAGRDRPTTTSSWPATAGCMEMLSEHQCEGWLEGYLLTGRHGLFNCYEAFIHIVDSMFNQHAKWLKVTARLAVAAQDRVAELSAELACVAAGSQWVHASGSRVHRSRGQQEGRDRARVSAAGCELPAVGHGSLPAQPPLRQRRGRRQAPGSSVAGDGRGREALQRGHRRSGSGRATIAAASRTWSWPAPAMCRRSRLWRRCPSCVQQLCRS